MASLILSTPMIKKLEFGNNQLHSFRILNFPRQHHYSFPCAQQKTWPLLCTKLLTWEASSPYSSINDKTDIIKGSNIVEPIDVEESTQVPLLQSKQDVIDMSDQQFLQHQPLKWPMWLMGPSILLATGMLPTLWLPLSSVFIGPNIAGLLSLVGLDCIFNIGATLFLLMADACARPWHSSSPPKIQVPLPYMLWNMGANLLGFLAPLLMLFASHCGSLVPQISFISFALLLGPYLLLLSVQMMTEMLTWHWKSPVWLVTPIVYEAYRILQLMRGLRLGDEVSAPGWAITSIRLLVSWWALILGIQLMRVAWFSGLNYGSQSSKTTV